MSALGTLRNVFKVIYAPSKAFKEISQNPRYIGPILIIILFILAQTGLYYMVVSKSYVEQSLPTSEQLDAWTENATLWTASPVVTVIDNQVDYINGTYYGDKSIEFSIGNSRLLSIELNDIGPVDCSGADGYKNLSLRIKQTSPAVKPEDVTIYLFSLVPYDYFYYNITDKFSNATINVWNNLTVQLESEGWLTNNTIASWSNITGLKLEFVWPYDSNITLLVDGLFFRGIYKTPIEAYGTGVLLNFPTAAFMRFVIQWCILSGLLYIMTKALRAKAIWKTLLICVGFALITMFIQTMINIAAYSTLPTLYYSLDLIGGVKGEFETAASKFWEETWIVYDFSRYLEMTVYMWTIGLCAIATRLLTEFSWLKSLLVSSAALLITLLVMGLLQTMGFIIGY